MSAVVLPHCVHAPRSAATSVTRTVGVVLVLWLALIFILGSQDRFVTSPGTPPLALLLAVTLPIVVFLVTYRVSERIRAFVLDLDLRLAMGIQAWRFAGLGFLALYTHHVLPGVFAWPAGLGDIAIGVSAPWLLVALIRNPALAASRGFVAWNLFGLLDLAVAVGIGTLVASVGIGTTDGTTTGVMSKLPLLLVPGFLVPVFVMLHIATLLQARRLAGAVHSHSP
jgi:hypothetical protein